MNTPTATIDKNILEYFKIKELLNDKSVINCTFPKSAYILTAKVLMEDKSQVDTLAKANGIPSGWILRCLVKSVLQKEILLTDILKKNENTFSSQKIGPKGQIKTRLTEEEKSDFFGLLQQFSMMPGTLARILITFFLSFQTPVNQEKKAS
jgi:hypothetical protein